MLVDTISNFKQAMAEQKINYDGEIIADSKLHRFHITGDKLGSKNGWFILYPDNIPSGAFGSWRKNISITWCSKSKSKMTRSELIFYYHKMDLARKERKLADTELKKHAALRANTMWINSKSASSEHPYLINKKISADRFLRQINSLLLIPLIDLHGDLHNLQLIDANGNKKFLYGGRVKGLFSLLGSIPNTGKLYLCEGWATAKSIFDLTGCTTVAAMNAGNLKPVATNLRLHLPQSVSIVVATDNDRYTIDNPGLTKGKEAAISIGADFISPQFSCSHNSCTDFNDLQNCSGNQGGAI